MPNPIREIGKLEFNITLAELMALVEYAKAHGVGDFSAIRIEASSNSIGSVLIAGTLPLDIADEITNKTDVTDYGSF